MVTEYETQKKALDEEKKDSGQVSCKSTDPTVRSSSAEKAADYLMASWQLGPRKQLVEDVARESNGLDHDVLSRWIKFLDPERKREYEFLDSWQALSARRGSGSQSCGKALRNFNPSSSPPEGTSDLEVQNAKIKARTKEGDSPITIPLERSKYYLLKDLATAPDKKPAPDKKTKKEAGPYYFSPDEVGRYLSSVYKEYFDVAAGPHRQDASGFAARVPVLSGHQGQSQAREHSCLSPG